MIAALRYGSAYMINRACGPAPLVLLGLIFTASAGAQQTPMTLTSAVEPIQLTLTAPGDGEVIDLLPADRMTGFTKKDPVTGLAETYHPFSAARVTVNSVEQQVTNSESKLREIESALDLAGFPYADLDINYFALGGTPSLISDPSVEAAWSVINQDGTVAEDLFNANLIDPWGANAVNPMRLAALTESQDFNRALTSAKRHLNGRAIATDAQLALALASVSLRVVRSHLGLEGVRVKQLASDVEPRLPNSERLLVGSIISLQTPFGEGLQQCDDLVSYWRGVESKGVWTAADAAFARKLAGDDWPTNGDLPYVTHSGEAVPLIGEELERECDEAHKGLTRLKGLRTIATIGVASIDVVAGTTYLEDLYPPGLPEQTKFDSGVKRAEQTFALQLDPSRLLAIAQESGVEEGIVSIKDARGVRDQLLALLERLKWDNFKFRGNNRRPSNFEVDTLTAALLRQTIASVGVLEFKGKLLSIDEMPQAVFPIDLAPAGFDRADMRRSDYVTTLDAINSRLGYALLRLNDSSRPLDLRILATSDAAVLVLESNAEKKRLATALHSDWTRFALGLDEIRKEYDSGRIWVKEAIRTTFAVRRTGDIVAMNQPLLIAEATSRFRVSVDAATDAGAQLGSLPFGARLAVTFDATGLPPLSHEARQKILSSPSPKSLRDELSRIYEHGMHGVQADATVVAQTDKGTTLEIKMTDVPSVIGTATAEERAKLSNLGFVCSPANGDDASQCAFPLGPMGANSRVSLSIKIADSVQADEAKTDYDWRHLVAE
jgi:hypothetical protein